MDLLYVCTQFGCLCVCRCPDALREQSKACMKDRGIDPPSLCACHADMWDSGPLTCANNCMFYRNQTRMQEHLHYCWHQWMTVMVSWSMQWIANALPLSLI